MNEFHLESAELSKIGYELQQARKLRGLTQEEAAKKIDIARTTLIAIEKGERQVKANELIQLAQIYGRSVNDFVRARPTIESFEQPQFRSANLQSQDEAQVHQSIQAFEEVCRNYLELEQITHSPMIQTYPAVYQYKNMKVEQAAEALAMAERNRLGLGDGPIPLHFRDVLEQNVGLRIFFLPLQPSSKLSGIYIFTHSLGGCIAINSQHPEERRRLSLAHDYAHFLVHRFKIAISGENFFQRQPESERFANAFSYYFLMPTNNIILRFNAIYQSQGRITPAELVKFAYEYGVSLQAMTYRLEEMRLIPSGIWERLQERKFRVREAQQQLGLPELPKTQNKFPSRYVKLAVSAYHKGDITEGQLAHFLQTDRLEARTIASDARWDVAEAGFAAESVIDQDVMELAHP